MIKKRRGTGTRVFAYILALALLLPSNLVRPPVRAYVEKIPETIKAAPRLSQTSYRYLLEGESYDFNIRNKEKGYTYEWKSSNTKVATVNKVGLVNAKKAGMAEITCIVTTEKEEYRLEAVVYVRKPTKNPADGVKINNKVDRIIVGETYNLNKDYLPAGSTDQINWISSNTDIAVVNERGFVTGIKEGLVKITATTMMNKVSDSVSIVIMNEAKVGSQSELEKALSSKAGIIHIATEEEIEFVIPEGDYSDKNLIVNIPNGSIKNHGIFEKITVNAIKSDSWYEYAYGNRIIIETETSRIIIEDGAKASVYINKSGSKIIIEVIGNLDLYADASGDIEILGEEDKTPTIYINAEDVMIHTKIALLVNASQKAIISLDTPEASNTVVIVNAADFIPVVKGTGYVKVEIGGESRIIYADAPPSSGGTTPGVTPKPSPTPVPERFVTASFGSPYVDGEIDECWEDAEVIIPEHYQNPSEVKAEHRIMWDDNALYVLSEITDSDLNKTNSANHEQDSLELFLDERYDRATTYQSDDLQYRVNYDNQRSYDKGEPTRFYSGTKMIEEDGKTIGYIVEACIVWADETKPVNGLEMGFDLQINEAKNGSRVSMITIFDGTFKAWENPSLFGKLILEGKADGDVSGSNPYSLFNYIDSVEAMYLDIYINAEDIIEPLANAKAVAGNPASTQEEIDKAFAELRDAVNSLDDGSGFTKPSALPIVRELPDPFEFNDGSKVTSLNEWRLRQDEISKFYQYYMYGVVPDQSDETVTYEFIDQYTTMVFDWETWQMVERTIIAQPNQDFINISIERNGRHGEFRAIATYPAIKDKDPETGIEVVTGKAAPIHEGGYPVLIVIGSLGANQKQYLNDNGFAVIEYNNNDIAADNASRTGVFYNLYPYGRSWEEQTGVLMAWGWGMSKIIDVLEIDSSGEQRLGINPKNTMVTGISRNGKAAAVAGAFDSRVKITVPGCSGAGGMANFRYDSAGKQYNYSALEKHEFTDQQGEANGTATWEGYQKNPIHEVGNNEQLNNLQAGGEAHWFNDKFLEFSSRYQLPFDQHYLAALTAEEGRYFFITGEIVGGDWTNPAAMYVSYLAAQNVYDSLGISDNLAIHLHAVGHAFTLEDTKYLVDFANLHLYNKTGKMDLSQLKTSIFEERANYDTYFDDIKAMKGPDLTQDIVYSETFDMGIPSIISVVSGASISIDKIGSNNVLRVDTTGDDAYITLSLTSVTGPAIITDPDTGSSATIVVSIMYNEVTDIPAGFVMGIVDSNGPSEKIIFEATAGENKGKWITLKMVHTFTDKNDSYIYLKCLNAKSYFIDNIFVTRD